MFHILVFTDANNQVYEHSSEDDNLGYQMVCMPCECEYNIDLYLYHNILLSLHNYVPIHMQAPIEVTLAPPPDLVVSSIQSDDAYVTGRVMTIRYNVSNIGAGEPYESYWQDIAVSTVVTRKYAHPFCTLL